MVTFPEDFDPSEYGYSHEHDVYDEDYQPPKLEDFTIEERGATIRIELEGSYILPAQKENLDLVINLIKQLTRVQTLFIKGKKYRKINDEVKLEPKVFIDAKGVYLKGKDKNLEITGETPLHKVVNQMGLEQGKKFGGIKDES